MYDPCKSNNFYVLETTARCPATLACELNASNFCAMV